MIHLFISTNSIQASQKNLQTINAWEDVKKREPSCTIGGNVNWYDDFGEQCNGSLTDWKENYHMTQQSHSWVWKWKLLSCVWLSLIPWAIQSMEFSKSRILEWVAFPFSKGSSQSRIEPRSPILQADSLPAEPQGKPKNTGVGSLSLLQWIFLTQESNQGLLHCRSYEGSPIPGEIHHLKNTCTPVFTAALFTIASLEKHEKMYH